MVFSNVLYLKQLYIIEMVSRFNRREAEIGRKSIVSMLRTHQIMDKSQIRDITNKWQSLEKEIAGSNRSLAMFCEYYKYQEDLCRDVCSKTSQKHIVKEKLEKLFVSDMKQLLDFCMSIPDYQGEFDAIMMRIALCRMTGDFNTGTKAVDSLIKSHSSNPQAWIAAGKWFVHLDKGNIALHILQQALKVFSNPVDTDICEYLISLEIDIALGKHSSESFSEQQIEYKKKTLLANLNAYMNDFSDREWQDSKFLILILDMLDGYPFTKPIQSRLCDILSDKFGNRSGKIWQLFVKRALKNINKLEAYNKGKELYQTGLEKLATNPDECRWLWRQNLDFLIDIDGKMLSMHDTQNQTLYRKYLIDAFTEAADKQMLSDKHYVKWLDYAFDTSCEEAILQRGIKEFPSSVELRVVALNRELWADSPNVEESFLRAVEACGDNALLLWTARLRFMDVKYTVEESKEMYLRAIDVEKVPPVIVENLKPRYIEWVGRTMSPDAAMREYSLLADKKPYCKRLHKVALSLLACCCAKSNHVPKIHRRLLTQFSKDTDVYYDFIRYYYQLDVKPIEERKEAIEKIYEEAREALDEAAFSALDIQYSDLKENEMLYFASQLQ